MRIRGIAGGKRRIPVAVAIAMAEVGVQQRVESTARQIDDRIARVLAGRATDADFEQLQRDLARCERALVS